MSGLLINGKIVPVDGLTIIGPRDPGGVALNIPEDGCARARRFVQQWIVHKTIADDPEKLLPGAGPSARAGGAADTAYVWGHDGKNSGAHLVVGHDGEVLQTADLLLVEAYHATMSNPYSVGVETKELVGGGFYQTAADAVVKLTIAGCRALGIQMQMPKLGSYHGAPIPRMDDVGHTPGGPDMVGIFEHRHNTGRRGKWDAGEIIPQMFAAAGVEQFDFVTGEDLAVWKGRQRDLVARGHKIVVDGIPGPATVAALKAEGYRDGIYVLGKV